VFSISLQLKKVSSADLYTCIIAKASKSSQPKAASTASAAKPTGTATSGAGAGSVGASKIIKVVVGSPTLNKSLVFTPSDIKAAPGDIVQFQFSQINHTVTQSTFSDACQPIQASDPAAGGIHSGFVPTTAGQATVPAFNMPINDTNPMFLYCAQGPHCQLGMVMAINA
jgi:plastocyanin